MPTETDMLLTHASIATMAGDGNPYSLIPDAGLVIADGRIGWVGPLAVLPEDYRGIPERDLGGKLVTPALIDCHTHVIHAGNRAREFEMRMEGASYEEIARAGGGILSTVKATRQASEDELVASALPRVDAMLAEGIATLEIKSGYGLDLETELRMLRAARRIAEARPVTIHATFLGAHAIPPEYRERADEYIDFICDTVLPVVHQEQLAEAVDAFCERIAFNTQQVARLFTRARELGLAVKLHGEQLSDSGGAEMAASFNALSVDHLEYLDSGGIEAMSQAGSVAVLLPGAFYTLRETRLPPIEALREAGVPVAIATDSNPGSSPVTSPLIMLNMACTLFRMTPEEALAGMTRHAARALGLEDDSGTIEAGKRADLAIWDVDHPAELAYYLGMNRLAARVYKGRLL